jgi:hypothetical protein
VRTLRLQMRLAAALVPVLALVGAWCAQASAAPAPVPPPRVSIERNADYVPRSGTVDVGAAVALDATVRRLTVRFRILSPSGTTVYQQSDTRSRQPKGTYVFTLRRSVSAMGLKEGVNRLEVRVEADGASPVTLTEPLIVVDTARAPVPLAIVVRLRGTPMVGPDGALASDPATHTAARDQGVAAAQLHQIRPDIVFTLAPPPVVLDDWTRIGNGYTPPGGGSGSAVSRDTSMPATYRAALRALSDASAAGLPSLVVPYAEPDLAGLAVAGALDDLAAQLDLGSRAVTSTLGTREPGVMLDGELAPRAIAPLLESRGLRYAVIAPDAAPQSRGTTPSPGVYRVEGASLVALVTDPEASSLLSDATTTRWSVLAHLFERAISKKDRGQPVVAVVEVGDGAKTTVADLQAVLVALKRASWVRLITVTEAAAIRATGALTLPDAPASADPTASLRWRALAAARGRARAMSAAAGPQDLDAIACERGVLLAESSVWDAVGSPAGEAYAAEADRRAASFLSRIRLASPDVTLSGTSGKIRVSISNDTGKVLSLTLVAEPRGMRVLEGASIAVSAPPGETILTVPVQVRESLAGSLRLRLLAGTEQVAESASTVRAGFMDRLVTVGTAMMVLLVLLWYIRRRGMHAVERMRGAVAARRPRPNRTPKDEP